MALILLLPQRCSEVGGQSTWQRALVASARGDDQEIWEGRQVGLMPCSDSLCMRGWMCFVFCFFLYKKYQTSSCVLAEVYSEDLEKQSGRFCSF